MKADNPIKHFLLAFLIALGCYLVFYHGIEHRRNRKGPWQVTFTNNTAAAPEIIVNQPRVAITNVHITFVEEKLPTNNDITLRFNIPKPVPYAIPFGKCVFMDTTFLPGTATFQLFGHEIELLPRVFIIDHEEHPWVPNAIINLQREPRAPAR